MCGCVSRRWSVGCLRARVGLSSRDVGITERNAPAESSSTTLEDVTNTPRHSEDGAGGSRVSQGLTKQWVRLRQQLAEARQTIMAKESLVSKLHGQLQQGARLLALIAEDQMFTEILLCDFHTRCSSVAALVHSFCYIVILLPRQDVASTLAWRVVVRRGT